MERETNTNSKEGSVSMSELEGVLVIEEGSEFSPLSNLPITEFLVPHLVKQTSY